MKTLLIDGQVFQSATWHRGMGKYSLSLLKYLLANHKYPYEHTMIIFNDALLLEEDAEKVIAKTLPSAEQIYLPLKTPNLSTKTDIPTMQRQNREILDQFIATQSLVGDCDFFIPSLFVDQVCSVFPLSSNKNILIFYDLIPIQYIERYSGLSTFQNYLKRFTELLKVDIYWAISQTVADDLVINLGISRSKVFNIDGAPIERQDLGKKRPMLDLSNRYLLMPSGNEIRKNNMRAVQAFEQYRQRSGDDIYLVLSSYFDENTKQQLLKESNNIIFSGNVSEAELAWLYHHAAGLLFVPEYEGLGLPILEAVEASIRIICSNIGVFNEISTDAFFYCDHLDTNSISKAIEEALTSNQVQLQHKVDGYEKILKRYNWSQSASKAIKTLKVADHTGKVVKRKLAVLGPDPSGYSDIGKRVAQMHPSLSAYFDVDYYVERAKTTHSLPRIEYLSSVASVHDASEFTKNVYKKYDAVLYHIGNSEFHIETIRCAMYLPGYAIIHDTHLGNIFEGELLAHNYISKERYDEEKKIDEQLGQKDSSFLCSLTNRQLGVLTHSQYATRAIRSLVIGDTVPITQANLPVPAPTVLRYKNPNDKFTIGFAGIIHPAKGLDIIEKIAQEDQFAGCNIHVFGMSLVPEDVLDRLRAYPNVSIDINVTDFEFQSMLARLDVLVNFRKEYRGEASGATLEAMRFGVVPIVKKVGWYDELPDDIALKANTTEEVISLIAAYKNTKFSARLRNAEAARKFVEVYHNYDRYAQSINNLLSGDKLSPNKVIEASIRSGASREKLIGIINEV